MKLQYSTAWSYCLFALLLAACTATPTCPPPVTLAPTTTTAAPAPTATAEPSPTAAMFEILEVKPAATKPHSSYLPDRWTRIQPDKITLYPYNRLNDYAVATDGSLWLAGGFGVIHQTRDGQQTWYSIKNGLTNNYFNVIALSPQGEVWAGGKNNALFRFDGQQWVDEGERLPPPLDDRDYNWLCFSRDISGIDFGPDGAAWVMNNGIELYRQAYGQWINVPFPKNLLPVAGGGACPEGILVQAEDNITIKKGPC